MRDFFLTVLETSLHGSIVILAVLLLRLVLKKASKIIRKQNGSLWIISQNLIDFIAPEIERYGQVIIDNSSYLIVMAQGQKEIEAVQKMMNLSESERQFLTTASKGQGLFVISQDTRLPIKVELREEEKELFGTAGGR